MTLEETHCSFDHFADDRYLLNYNNLFKKINKRFENLNINCKSNVNINSTEVFFKINRCSFKTGIYGKKL